MRNVQVRMSVPVDAGQGFEKISDFACYPDLVDVVRSVIVHNDPAGPLTSDWEVYFRNGILRWAESDRLDRDGMLITFAQTDGDFDHFTGHWCIIPQDAGCHIHFAADFDFGIPSLAGILDPIAERTFQDTVFRIVAGLFGGAQLIEVADAASEVSAHSCRRPALAGNEVS
jgi:ribosome-associated toxin RatA of RatAB toxin-antitoxin module